MAYVPCLINSNYLSPGQLTPTKRTTRETDGTVKVYYQNCSPWSDQRGSRSGSKGSHRIIRGAKWAPVRSYDRLSIQTFYTPGTAKYEHLRSKAVATDEGYPQPNAIWNPLSHLPALTAIGDHAGWKITGFGSAGIPANNLSRLKTNLLVKAGKRQVNYGEALAESKSTLRMLVNAASSLTRAVLAARKGRWDKVARHLKVPRKGFSKSMSASQKWLAYQYGWMPLINDIYDSYEFVNKGFDRRPQILSVSTRHRDQYSHEWSHSAWDSVPVRGSASYQGKMFYRIADNFIAKAHQMGLINPLEVAWAVVPFSFVIDWLVPVGNYLEALTARCALTFVDGFYGCKIETISRLVGPKRDLTGWKTLQKSSAGVVRDHTSYTRIREVSLPWPGLHMKSPFSTKHILSGLALLRTLWR